MVAADATTVNGQTHRDLDEMASIIYTSGSTGNPKWAMVSFDAMFQSAKGFCKTMGLSDERFISYMPLSHVYERLAVESIALFSGSSLWFAESLDTFLEDVKRARPTLFYSVPRLWTKFQLVIFKKMPPEKLDRLLKIPILNRLIKKKIRKGLGLDCARFGFAAGAPMSKELISWYGKLGLEVLEVYAMTENFGYSHFSRPGKIKLGYVGTPHLGVEHKLSDQGEILVKSPGAMMGYFNNPEATEGTFDEAGFLRTGDLGVIDDSGNLKVIGRLKEEFKTTKGKYISPAPIENIISDHPMVEASLVSGSGQAQPYGIILLSPEWQRLVDS